MLKAKSYERKSELNERFKLVKKTLDKLLFKSKQNYYNNFFIEHKSNLVKTWDGIKSIINMGKTSDKLPQSMTVNKNITNDHLKICKAFNKFYGSIAEETKSKIIRTDKSFKDYLTNQNRHSFFFNAVTTEEIGIIIKSLDPRKATGPFSIPTNILKLLLPVISKPLCDVINLSFQTGIFPDCLKLADVMPVFKKGSKNLIENYRPISLLSNISKIFEKVVHTRLSSFLDRYSILYQNQFGFRRKHATSHALIELTQKIREALDNKLYACGIFVDFSKAFDTVEHEILIAKLEHYGIRNIQLNWFKSYLSDRKQSVIFHQKKSEYLDIKHGVPQGSVLGPLLFLIYINDLHCCIESSQITLQMTQAF